MTMIQPLRVLHLSNHLSTRGNGIVNVAVDLAIEQARSGCNVAIASAGGGFQDLLQAAGVQCIHAPQTGTAVITNLVRLYRVLRTFRPDVIHAHMRSGLLLVWPLAKLLRIPVVMHLHNIHDRHHRLVRLADRVIAVSESVRLTLAAEGVPRDRIRVVLNGVLGTERWATPPANKELQHPAIVTVGGMVHRKGIAELIDAFARIAEKNPAAHLYLVGTGPEEREFRARAEQLPVRERIHFEDYQADPRSYLRAADVFVLASRRESFGLVLLEARAEGCAIVGTKVDGIPELLDDGRAGLLTPVGDPVALAAQLHRLLEDETLRHELQQRAQQDLQRFTTASMAARMYDVYVELLRNRSHTAFAAGLSQSHLNVEPKPLSPICRRHGVGMQEEQR